MRVRASVVCSAILLSGCAADPSVRPVFVRSAQELPPQAHETYALQESSILLESTTTGEGANRRTNITSKYIRSEQPGVRVALIPNNSPGVRTEVTIERFENTDLPKKVDINVIDERVALIGQVGGVITSAVTTLVGLSGGSERADIELPYRLNVTDRLRAREANAAQFSISDPNRQLDIVLEPLGPDALPINAQAFGNAGPWFYYAACRTARITFRHAGRVQTVTHRISDPHFLQRVRMPVKGSITMHSECGASVTGTMANDDAASIAAITAALIAQGQAIQQAAQGDDDE